jgi:hypothetical protein
MKLTDTHRTILAAAGAREGLQVLPLPKGLKLSATKAEPLLSALLADNAIAERKAEDGETVWRNDERVGKLTLVATVAGLKVVGIESEGSSEADAPATKPRRAAGVKQPTSAKKAPAKALRKKSAANSSPAPKAGTKLATLVDALRSKKGATIEELMEATGWQAHSVRGAISGALKKKQGLNITSAAVDGRGRVYRIAE